MLSLMRMSVDEILMLESVVSLSLTESPPMSTTELPTLDLGNAVRGGVIEAILAAGVL